MLIQLKPKKHVTVYTCDAELKSYLPSYQGRNALGAKRPGANWQRGETSINLPDPVVRPVVFSHTHIFLFSPINVMYDDDDLEVHFMLWHVMLKINNCRRQLKFHQEETVARHRKSWLTHEPLFVAFVWVGSSRRSQTPTLIADSSRLQPIRQREPQVTVVDNHYTLRTHHLRSTKLFLFSKNMTNFTTSSPV